MTNRLSKSSNNRTKVPPNFSGVVEFKYTRTAFITGLDTVAIAQKHYLNGQLHRDDGPAIEWNDGAKEWFVFGKAMTKEEFGRFVEKKALNEKLQSTLASKPKNKRGKI